MSNDLAQFIMSLIYAGEEDDRLHIPKGTHQPLTDKLLTAIESHVRETNEPAPDKKVCEECIGNVGQMVIRQAAVRMHDNEVDRQFIIESMMRWRKQLGFVEDFFRYGTVRKTRSQSSCRSCGIENRPPRKTWPRLTPPIVASLFDNVIMASRGYLIDDEILRLADALTAPQPIRVTPPEFVRDWSELWLQGYVYTGEDKIIRLRTKGLRRAKQFLDGHG